MHLLALVIMPFTNPAADALVSHQITNAQLSSILPFPHTAVPSVLHPYGLRIVHLSSESSVMKILCFL